MKYRTQLSTLSLLAGAAFSAATLVSSSASACGGFFCSASLPVDQAAERIIFAMDETGHVTQIVEVLYEGPSEKFSWVLPVPGVPELEVSSSQVFDRLQSATTPRYQLNYQNQCYDYDDGLFAGGDGDGAPEAADPSPTVTVLDAGSVGPFDYETISVDAADQDPADVAVEWLETNGYDVGSLGPEVLRPYLQNGLNLIAIRLTKGETAGAIRPIVLEYEARALAIPILPTAVAAKDDMPILVWTLGAHRAVPTNYLDLELNELLIDWFNYRPTYDAVVTAAANEAGGQGFVTELAGEAGEFEPQLRPTPSDVDRALATETTELPDALDLMTRQLGNYDGFPEVASEHIPLRDGVTHDDFLSCVWCYFEGGAAASGAELAPAADDDPIYATDLDALRTAAREEVLQPFFDLADLMVENPYITRLYTTMSADEMTKDPVFEFNPDAEDVSRIHTADFDEDCETGTWSMELPGGETVFGEDRVWPYTLEDSGLPANSRIRRFSVSGAPELVTDNVTMIDVMHEEDPSSEPTGSSSGDEDGEQSSPDAGGGGGCSQGSGKMPSPWAWFGLGVLGVLAVRRRSFG